MTAYYFPRVSPGLTPEQWEAVAETEATAPRDSTGTYYMVKMSILTPDPNRITSLPFPPYSREEAADIMRSGDDWPLLRVT